MEAPGAEQGDGDGDGFLDMGELCLDVPDDEFPALEGSPVGRVSYSIVRASGEMRAGLALVMSGIQASVSGLARSGAAGEPATEPPSLLDLLDADGDIGGMEDTEAAGADAACEGGPTETSAPGPVHARRPYDCAGQAGVREARSSVAGDVLSGGGSSEGDDAEIFDDDGAADTVPAATDGELLAAEIASRALQAATVAAAPAAADSNGGGSAAEDAAGLVATTADAFGPPVAAEVPQPGQGMAAESAAGSRRGSVGADTAALPAPPAASVAERAGAEAATSEGAVRAEWARLRRDWGLDDSVGMDSGGAAPGSGAALPGTAPPDDVARALPFLDRAEAPPPEASVDAERVFAEAASALPGGMAGDAAEALRAVMRSVAKKRPA